MMILTTLPSPVWFSPFYLFFFPAYPCISFIPFVLFCETVILELLVQQWIWNYPLEPGWLPMGIWLKTMTATVSGFVKRHSFNLTSIHDWQLASSFFYSSSEVSCNMISWLQWLCLSKMTTFYCLSPYHLALFSFPLFLMHSWGLEGIL